MSKKWHYDIGHKVSFLTQLNSNNELELVKPSQKNDGCFIDTFLAIGKDSRDGELCLLVGRPDFDPHGYIITTVNNFLISQYKVDAKYKDAKCLKLFQSYVYNLSPQEKRVQIHKTDPGGSLCIICNQWITWASESNLPQGGYACYSCRDSKRWKIDIYLRNCGIDPQSFHFT